MGREPDRHRRLSMELWEAIRDEDWSIGGLEQQQPAAVAAAAVGMDKHINYTGAAGGYGIGYSAPATAGAALANKKHGRLTVSINGDGDFMCSPGMLWTAAHSRMPMLYMMHNNRAWHQEIMGSSAWPTAGSAASIAATSGSTW